MYQKLTTAICFILAISCTSKKAFFISPNSVNKMEGVVYMDDGTQKKGSLTISFENLHEFDNYITFKPDNDTVIEKLDVRDIKYYVINGHTYLPKSINLHLSNEYHYLFVERLTNENDKMQLYKLLPSDNTNVSGEEPYHLYISFPSFTKFQVFDINSTRLVPNFEYKISEYITDCPELLKKIKAKQEGYFYSLLSTGTKRTKVINNIVKAYNDCK